VKLTITVGTVLMTLTLSNGGQDIPAPGSSEWRYSKQDDPLHGTSFDQFILDGRYLTRPSQTDGENPALVVQCSDGKFRRGSLVVGTVIQHAQGADGGVAHSLKGITQAHVEMRWDERKKPNDDWWEISNDGRALFFDKIQLTKLLTGRLLGHPSDPAQLVHRQIIGVVEAFANETVMQFDMPKDSTWIVEACGLEWGKKKKTKE